LYLCEDTATAAAQIARLLDGTPVHPEDLRDDAFLLIPVTLPSAITAADAHTPMGLRALGLPDTYPVTQAGQLVPQATCQPIGDECARQHLRGVHARSATSGARPENRELAWYPQSGERAHPALPMPYALWRNAR